MMTKGCNQWFKTPIALSKTCDGKVREKGNFQFSDRDIIQPSVKPATGYDRRQTRNMDCEYDVQRQHLCNCTLQATEG